MKKKTEKKNWMRKILVDGHSSSRIVLTFIFYGSDKSEMVEIQNIMEMIKSEMTISAQRDSGETDELTMMESKESESSDGEIDAKSDEFGKYADDLDYLHDHFEV